MLPNPSNNNSMYNVKWKSIHPDQEVYPFWLTQKMYILHLYNDNLEILTVIMMPADDLVPSMNQIISSHDIIL